MHDHSTHEIEGIEVCHTCDPTGENNAHRPTAAAWARGETPWTNCDGEVIPSPAQ